MLSAAASASPHRLLAIVSVGDVAPCALSVLRAAVQILQVGPDNLEHPLNKKVRLQVYLRDLQEEAGLTEDALQHIAVVCGPRCVAGSLLPC